MERFRMLTHFYAFFISSTGRIFPELKALLDSSYKVEQGSWKRPTFKRPIQFLKAVQY